MPNKVPNPFLFVGLSLASFGAFYLLVKHRATTYPASQQARQHDNPLIPPRHPDSDKASSRPALHLHKNKDKKPAEKPVESTLSITADPVPATTTTPSEPTVVTSEAVPATTDQTEPTMSTSESKKNYVFDDSKVTVVFVLGGPGAGKGTQCENLVNDFGFCHLSAGDLLRAEQHREGSEYGEMIRTYIREGQIVPMEVTIKLLENAMKAALAEDRAGEGWVDSKGRFLIDGFPRKMDQAVMFDEEVCQCRLVLFFTTTEEEMLKRLLKRGETSGREDDNEESIKKRFHVYKEQTMPVIEYFSKSQKVATIDATATIEEVHQKAKTVVEEVFTGEVPRNITA